MVRRLVRGGPREKFSDFSLDWTPVSRPAPCSLPPASPNDFSLQKRCTLASSEVLAMTGRPTNGLPFLRVAFTGACACCRPSLELITLITTECWLKVLVPARLTGCKSGSLLRKADFSTRGPL